jgi:glutathione synthase/RimK-type ligase-like ATP-grasp enzyme
MLLYHKKSRPTGRVLGKALLIGHGESVSEGGADSPALIRWGSRKQAYLDEQYETVLNNSGAISSASNKLLSLELMREAGVNVPDFDTNPYALIERVGWPILGRKTYHARGSDVKLCLQQYDLRNPMDYYIQYIPTVREFRVHVVRDNVVRVQGKFLDFPRLSNGFVRNYQTGYRFRSPRKRLNNVRLLMAVQAVKSLGLDFGAVDLLIGDDRETYILEVNTAPSCSPLTATEYIMEFRNILGLEYVDFSQLDILDPNMDDERGSEDEYDEDF